MSLNFNGVLDELKQGLWKNPETGKPIQIPIQEIEIRDTLDGGEADLIAPLKLGKRLALVCDEITYEVLGRRVEKSLSALSTVNTIVLKTPKTNEHFVQEVQEKTRKDDAVIAVGSGTINDTCKYATFLDKKEYAVFSTSPMTAYTAGAASVSLQGFKRSLPAHSAKGVFIDLGILLECPPKLIRSGYADIICRTTSQIDWLTSNLLFNTNYSKAPYLLLAIDEENLIQNASRLLNGDLEIMAMLARMVCLVGLGTIFTASSHSCSMAEHMISHYLDMFYKNHPDSLHGEQVGVATLTMSKLQDSFLDQKHPPIFSPDYFEVDQLIAKFGAVIGKSSIQEFQKKRMDENKTKLVNGYFEKNWDQYSSRMKKIRLTHDHLLKSMKALGAPTQPEELGFDRDFYKEAVLYSRYIRDRYTYLDLATNCGGLENFIHESL